MKAFREYRPEQRLLLPPSLEEWVPENHLARFLRETMAQLDLSGVYASYEPDGRGQAAYHPEMMAGLLLYAYCVGRFSSRKIETATYEEVPYRYLAANQHPDHSTIAEFRQRHLGALRGLFVQVLELCRRAGLVKLGHVAIDGTKVQANAGRSRGISYRRMSEEEQRLSKEVDRWLAEAEKADGAEEEAGGERGVTWLPAELASKERRLETIRRVKAEMEGEARQEAERKKAEVERRIQQRQKQEQESGHKPRGYPPKVADPEQARPRPKAQRSLSDPEARLMRDSSRSFHFAYNAQAAVDSERQVIVAATVTQEQNDRAQLAPLVEQIQRNTGTQAEKVSADTGYYSPQLEGRAELAGVDLYVRPDPGRGGKARARADWKGPPPAPDAPWLTRQRYKMASAEARQFYGKRKTIVEPVFGQTKERQRFRRFSLRGLAKVTAEWLLVCLTHNLLKLYRWQWAPARA